MSDLSLSERSACDHTTVCVLDRGHDGPCQRPGGVRVDTTRYASDDAPMWDELPAGPANPEKPYA